jgi:hypothetical protein
LFKRLFLALAAQVFFEEDTFFFQEDLDINTITLVSIGSMSDVLINIFTIDQFIAMGGSLDIDLGIFDPAEVTDFDPTPISFTIPQSDGFEFLVNVPLNSIIQDTINEANEVLILTLDFANPEDVMASIRNVSILTILDDDCKKDTLAGAKIVAYIHKILVEYYRLQSSMCRPH